MKEIFNTLKKYTLSIIIMVICIIMQATLDLKLPDYTSDIVNIGIQQNGIKNTAIEKVRTSEYEKIKIFMDSNEEKIFKDNYKLNNNIYELKKDGNEEKISNILVEPLAIVSMLNNIKGESLKTLVGENIIVSPTSTFFEIYKLIPQESQKKIVKEIRKQFSDLEPSIKSGSAIEYIKSEYKVIGISLESKQSSYLFTTGLKMVVVALLSMSVVVLTVFTSSRMAARFSRDLRQKLVKKVLTFSNKEYEEFSTSSLITRSTNDIMQIQMFLIMGFRTLIYAPIVGIGAYIKVSQNEMGWVIGIAVLAIIIIVSTLFTVAMPKFKRIQELIDKLNLVFRETLTGLPVIRAFSNEHYEENKFNTANKNLMKTNEFVNIAMSFMFPLMSFVMNGVAILILWVGASKVNEGILQIGNLIAFMTYAIQIIMAFLMFSFLSIMIPRAFISFKRIQEIFNKETSIKEAEIIKSFNPNLKGYIEFKDVYFRYPDASEDVLEDISFTASPGKTTAFIGSTGSGKSTLINLIPRFFDATSGKILVDGVDIKECDLKELRSKIGYVPQTGILFSGTIESNINLGNEVNLNKQDLIKYSNIAQASNFIEEKEDKYRSLVSQGGTNLSGGQKQRLSIARALAINPDIYIFDDSFSALDFKTDARLRKEIKKITKDKTVLIVAQRVSTIMHADEIIVLDEGKIVGKGNHKDLLNSCNVYKEIVSSQLGKGKF